MTALPLLTETRAMQKHGLSADVWFTTSRRYRAMMTAAVVIDEAFEAIRAYDNRPKKK